jgi:hypothetical protein
LVAFRHISDAPNATDVTKEDGNMTTGQSTESTALTTTGIAGVIAAGAMVTFALFPLAIPFLLLTAVFAAPLALIGVAVAVPVIAIGAVVLAMRAMARRLRAQPSSSVVIPKTRSQSIG